MTNYELLLALGELGNRHVEAAAAPMHRRKPARRLAWAGLAAAACLLALLWPHRPSIPPDLWVEAPPSETPEGPPPADPDSPPAVLPSGPEISLSDLKINSGTSGPAISGAPPYFDPALYTQEAWDDNQIMDYLGRALTLPWYPEDMGLGQSQYIVRKNTGELVRDQLFLSCTNEERRSSLTLTVSRLGILGTGCVVLPDTAEPQVTDICGTEVTLSHRVTAGQDFYLARFALDGIPCQLQTQGLPLADTVRVLAGVILGCDSVIITE